MGEHEVRGASARDVLPLCRGRLVAPLGDGTNRAEPEPTRRRLRCPLHVLHLYVCMSLCFRDPPPAAAEHKGAIRRFRQAIGNSPGKGERAPMILCWPSTYKLLGNLASYPGRHAISPWANIGQGARQSHDLDTP